MRDFHWAIALLRKLAGNSSVPTSNKNAGIGHCCQGKRGLTILINSTSLPRLLCLRYIDASFFSLSVAFLVMAKPKILQEDRDDTFGSYFEMNDEPDEILAELDDIIS